MGSCRPCMRGCPVWDTEALRACWRNMGGSLALSAVGGKVVQADEWTTGSCLSSRPLPGDTSTPRHDRSGEGASWRKLLGLERRDPNLKASRITGIEARLGEGL